MAFQDRDLTCRDCGGSFVFTAGEQEFYATKGLEHDPVRCPNCRAQRKLMSPEDRDFAPAYGVYASWGGRTPRQLYVASCAQCAGMTEVPFRPRDDRPVYCSDCYGDLRKKQEAQELAEAASASARISASAGQTVELETPKSSETLAALAALGGSAEGSDGDMEAAAALATLSEGADADGDASELAAALATLSDGAADVTAETGDSEAAAVMATLGDDGDTAEANIEVGIEAEVEVEAAAE
jgi:CxxC-x17-CxxC domain-containing protein